MDVLREIPQKGEAMIQISRSQLLALTKRLCQAQYMNILLSSVAYVQNMHFTFTPRDVSEILGIEWSLFEKALIRAHPNIHVGEIPAFIHSTRWSELPKLQRVLSGLGRSNDTDDQKTSD